VVRVIAFVTGVAAGVGLLLFVVAGLSLTSAPVPVRAHPITLDVHQGTGSTFAHPTDPQDGLPSFGQDGLHSLGIDDDPDDGAQMDLQGDEVTPAIATYKFDAQGNIYETHAPHTEVPHLGSPTL
jgi:hypothetical protein